ncbi:MAG: M48 family metallopeptidase [Gammaproteobacteria bacterium]
MTVLQANFYDGKSAARRTVTIKLTIPGYLVLQDDGQLRQYALQELSIGERLGSQPAVIGLPDGERLEVVAAEEFYAAVNAGSGRSQWLYQLESRWSLTLLALAVTMTIAWVVYMWGIPAGARYIAYAMPPEMDDAIGQQGIELLDEYMFAPSELGAPRRAELQAVFQDVVDSIGEDDFYRLEFRVGGALGANALALPSGIIVLTDELALLAEHDEELAAIFAHEVGHVRNRHALRALIQNSVVAASIVILTSDVTSAGSIAAGIPTVLAEAGYSRAFETEADNMAYEYLEKADISPRRFGDIVLRLEQQTGEESDGLSLLSSHPAAAERARGYSE